jgi:dipeptidyl aminopeptidase/acylaminoacyl peptidase
MGVKALLGQIMTKIIEQVPVTITYSQNTNGRKMPLVFLNHGTGGDSSQVQYMAQILSENGCFCVSVDAFGQGSREYPGFERIFKSGNKSVEYKRKYLEMLIETCADISKMIDYYEKDERIDTQNIGITGISQGGFISFMMITSDKRITAAAPLIGSPDLTGEWGFSPEFGELPKDLRNEIIKYSPLNNFEKMTPCALFIQNGVLDKVVPVSGVRMLNEKLIALYKDGGYDYAEYPNIAHAATEYMQRRAADWLISHLLYS